MSAKHACCVFTVISIHGTCTVAEQRSTARDEPAHGCCGLLDSADILLCGWPAPSREPECPSPAPPQQGWAVQGMSLFLFRALSFIRFGARCGPCVGFGCDCVWECLSLCLCVRVHIDLTLLHSCKFVSLVTELLCALDHSSNAFALDQVAPQNRLPLDMVAER